MIYKRLKKREGCSSPYIGVSYNTRAKKWYAQIYIDKKVKHLGSFDCELDARDRFRDFVYENGLEHLYGPDVEEY